jgi:hypothetical protein
MHDDTTESQSESVTKPYSEQPDKPIQKPFRVTPMDLQLPKEWTSGSVSELLEMLEGRRYGEIDPEFLECLFSVHQKYLQLVNMDPVDRSSIPRDRKVSGVYLFSEGDVNFYVGRTTNLRQRLANHCGVSSAHNQAVFAFKLARHVTDNRTASYTGAGTRVKLLEDPAFAQAFVDSKTRVRNMKLRYVEEPDSLRQTLLEIYTASLLKTDFNDFDNH